MFKFEAVYQGFDIDLNEMVLEVPKRDWAYYVGVGSSNFDPEDFMEGELVEVSGDIVMDIDGYVHLVASEVKSCA